MQAIKAHQSFGELVSLLSGVVQLAPQGLLTQFLSFDGGQLASGLPSRGNEVMLGPALWRNFPCDTARPQQYKEFLALRAQVLQIDRQSLWPKLSPNSQR